jgi:hypothetical protein
LDRQTIMKASTFLATALGCGLFTSCAGTTQVMESIFPRKPSFSRSYDLNYRNAIAEGASAEEAHRRALLVAQGKVRFE